jgi:hypothetical protein
LVAARARGGADEGGGAMTARLWSCIVLAFMTAGCVSSLIYSPPEHCTVAIPDGMARVVANRAGSFRGGGVPMAIVDDGQPVAQLIRGDRVCWLRHAGIAYVTASMPGFARDIDVKLAPGETAVIEIALGEAWKLVRVQR